MRLIDLEAIRPRIRDEIYRLEEAKQEVLGESDVGRRRALFDRYQARWTAVRKAFEEQSWDKCWYVECRSRGADNDIDHFRPKLSVAEDASHPGYYWLGFEWTNLRLSCQRANRPRRNPETGDTGGKSDHFPLVNPEQRARSPSDKISTEIPAILDPTNAADVAMLTFEANGDVVLAPHWKGKPTPEAKLDASRLYLHLDWPKFREARVTLYNKIERFVRRGERLAPEEDFEGMHVVAEGFLEICNDLASYIAPDREYSMAARAYVEKFRDRWWVGQIVLRVT